MATKPLNKLHFTFKQTKNPTGGSAYDQLGTFSCRANVADFLGITEKAFVPPTRKKKADGTRITSLVGDGYALKEGGSTTITVTGGEVPNSSSSKGSRTVRLTTNAPRASKKGYHTVSFRFPGWATIFGISDALAETIPPERFGTAATDVQRKFTVVGGRSYQIMALAAATANTATDVGTTEPEAQALADQQNRKEPKPPTP